MQTEWGGMPDVKTTTMTIHDAVVTNRSNGLGYHSHRQEIEDGSVERLIHRIEYILDQPDSRSRVETRAHLTNHDLRMCLSALQQSRVKITVKEAFDLAYREFPDGRYETLINAGHRAGFMRALRVVDLISDQNITPEQVGIGVHKEVYDEATIEACIAALPNDMAYDRSEGVEVDVGKNMKAVRALKNLIGKPKESTHGSDS